MGGCSKRIKEHVGYDEMTILCGFWRFANVKRTKGGKFMGQRSQIYIRYNVNYVSGAATKNPTTHNYKGLIARYFGWNYGERSVMY